MQEQETPIQPEETSATPQSGFEAPAAENAADPDANTQHDGVAEEVTTPQAGDTPGDATEEDKPTAEEAATEEPEPIASAIEDDEEEEENLEDDPELRGILESLVFASDEPITFRQIKDIVAPEAPVVPEEKEEAPGRRRRTKKPSTINSVKRAIDVLNIEYEESGRSFRIIEVSGGFAFQTTPQYGSWVGKLFAERSRRRLTQSALETLSIIAFRQPISKPAVEAIRGVNAEHVVKSLLERNLISIVGREDSPGRPLLYGTTKTFLRHFGLSSINDLPRPREIKDLLSSEDELAMHPIEEMDPNKAAELTRVSSQELERLFDTAQLRETTETAGDEDDSAPPTLHVHFDSDGIDPSAEAAADDDTDDADDTDDTGDSSPGTAPDTDPADTDDDESNDEQPTEDSGDETPVEENPFDEDEPDEDEEV